MPQSGLENTLLTMSAKTTHLPLFQEVQSSQLTSFSQDSGSTAITSTTNAKERTFQSGRRIFPYLGLACLGNLVLFVWKAHKVPVKNSGQGWLSQLLYALSIILVLNTILEMWKSVCMGTQSKTALTYDQHHSLHLIQGTKKMFCRQMLNRAPAQDGVYCPLHGYGSDSPLILVML